MKSISLPIQIQKDITVYNNYALPLCILKSSCNYDKAIISHFDNIYLMRNQKNYLWMDFLERDGFFIGDFFNVEYLNLKQSFELENLYAFISDVLDTNRYLLVMLNSFYIENSAFFKRIHHPAIVLVFSISFEKRQIGTIMLTKDGNYNIEFFSFEAFSTAFYNYDLDKIKIKTWADWYKISILSSIPFDSTIKCEELIQQIENYITSKDMKNKLRKEIVDDRGDKALYGISVYTELIKSIEESKNGIQLSDYRHIHLIYEHSKFIGKKLEYLHKEGLVSEERYKKQVEVEKLLNITRLFYMKGVLSEPDSNLYGPLKDKNIINKIIANITIAQERQLNNLQNL